MATPARGESALARHDRMVREDIMLKRALTLIAVVLLLPAPLPGRATADDALVVVGGTLIDGTGRAPRPATAIIIRGGARGPSRVTSRMPCAPPLGAILNGAIRGLCVGL